MLNISILTCKITLCWGDIANSYWYQQFIIVTLQRFHHLVSVSDRNLLIVVCVVVVKLYLYSPSSPKPWIKFKSNLLRNILGKRAFKFVQTKGQAIFQVEIVTKQRKYIDGIQKSSPDALHLFQQQLAQSIFESRGFQFSRIRNIYFPIEDMFLSLIITALQESVYLNQLFR